MIQGFVAGEIIGGGTQSPHVFRVVAVQGGIIAVKNDSFTSPNWNISVITLGRISINHFPLT